MTPIPTAKSQVSAAGSLKTQVEGLLCAKSPTKCWQALPLGKIFRGAHFSAASPADPEPRALSWTAHLSAASHGADSVGRVNGHGARDCYEGCEPELGRSSRGCGR